MNPLPWLRWIGAGNIYQAEKPTKRRNDATAPLTVK
jgi:hypothetical protein